MENLYTQTCTVNYELNMVTLLDKHNNYFTLMMLIIGIPVKLSCRLDCDIPLMAVLKRAEEPRPSQKDLHSFSYIIYIITVRL